MKIDFHTHIFPDSLAAKAIAELQKAEGLPAYTEGTAASLLASSQRADVGISVVLPVVTKPTQSSRVNDDAIRYNERFVHWLEENKDKIRCQEKQTVANASADTEPILYSFGGLHPDNEDYKEQIDTLYRNGVKGIKLHPVFQLTYFDDIRYMRMIDYASEKGMYINVHAGRDINRPRAEHSAVDHLIPVLKELKPPKLILAHMGGWNCWDIVEEMLEEYKPYVDTSFCLYREDEQPSFFTPMSVDSFRRCVRSVGCEKVIFGTDSPWTDQEESLILLRKACENEEQFEQITFKNGFDILTK